MKKNQDRVNSENIFYSRLFCEKYFGDSTIEIRNIPEGKNKTPDIYIPEKQTVIEVKKALDFEEWSRSGRWGIIVNKLQKLINGMISANPVEGLFSIDVPWDFKLQKDFELIAQKIADACRSNEKSVDINGIKCEINRFGTKQDNNIIFSSHGPGGAYDAAGSFASSIKKLLPNVNNQLAFQDEDYAIDNKILLLVNLDQLVRWDWDFYNGMSTLYENLLSYQNIDEIWVLFETKENVYTKLLFKRELFEKFEAQSIDSRDQREQNLFGKWISPLFLMNNDKKEKIFTALKFYLESLKGHEVFYNPDSRIEIVRIAEWLCENERWDDAIWLVERFINDTDPPRPVDIPADEEFNFHKKVEDQESVDTINTVLGHLAWAVLKLTLNKNTILKAFDYSKKLSEHPNLYVKMQSLIPLTEIARRKKWLKEYDDRHETTFYDRFILLIKTLLNDLYQYKATRSNLTILFNNIRDFNEIDALEVIKKLISNSEVGPMLIYYALFREMHSDELGIPYNSQPVLDFLTEIINSQEAKYKNIKNKIAWIFWKITVDEAQYFDNIKPYIDNLSRQAYEKGVTNDIVMIINHLILSGKEAELALSWFENIINSVFSSAEDKENCGDIWLNFDEAVFILFAKVKRVDIISIIEKLTYIWLKGAFIGEINKIFSSYQSIEDEDIRQTVKKEFQNNYKKMKKVHPKLQEVNWI